MRATTRAVAHLREPEVRPAQREARAWREAAEPRAVPEAPARAEPQVAAVGPQAVAEAAARAEPQVAAAGPAVRLPARATSFARAINACRLTGRLACCQRLTKPLAVARSTVPSCSRTRLKATSSFN